jgi:hypothetical protein
VFYNRLRKRRAFQGNPNPAILQMTLYGIVSEMNNKAEIKTNKILSSLDAEQAAKPDHLKRIAGVGLTLLGGLGCVVTSPLLLLGGGLGLITGMFWQSNPWESGLQGAKIGSLGAIFTMLLGIELIQATVEPEERPEENHPLLQEEQPEPEIETPKRPPTPNDDKSVINELASNTQSEQHPSPIIAERAEPERISPDPSQKESRPSSPIIVKKVIEPASTPAPFFPPPLNRHRSTQSFNFKEMPEQIAVFTKTVMDQVAENESKIQSIVKDDVSLVSELYITRLVEITTNSLSSEDDFWGRLEQMSAQDIKNFVGKLNPDKAGGVRVSSELDYLWRRFKGVEFELSKQEDKRNKFALMLGALSTEQLKAAFNSADFLNIMNQDVYVETAANTLTSEQLKLFAANNTKHDILNLMIKKMKPNGFLLGKLMAIMPFATEAVKSALLDQITHLPNPASFNIELAKLAEHHIYENNPYRKRMRHAEEDVVVVQPMI